MPAQVEGPQTQMREILLLQPEAGLIAAEIQCGMSQQGVILGGSCNQAIG